MKAFHFGPSSSPRFGLFQPPAAAAPARSVGVLLCYPGVQEYNQTHWAFRKLAGLLNRSGFPVLRFDYACTGDSSGDTEDGRIATWLEDISLAAQELKDIAEVSSISVVGMRLGAALAARAVANGLEVKDLVLWDPVVSGKQYVAELEALDALENERLLHPVPKEPRQELAGFPFSIGLQHELDALSLDGSPPRAASRVCLLSSKPAPELEALQKAWSQADLEVTLDTVEDAASITSGGAREAAALYTNLLAAIADKLSGDR